MKSRLFIVVFIAVAVIAVVGGGFWLRSQERAELLAASVPQRPPLDPWPEEFRQRIESCERRISSGADAVAAIGELSRLYHANGFYEEAGQCYNGLVQLDRDEAVWPHRHAVILAGFGEAERALPLWRRAIELDPSYLPAQLKYGDLLFKQNRNDEAAAVYQRVLDRQSGEPYAMLGLARCEFDADNWESARALLEAVVPRTNHRLGYDLIVTVYEKLGLDARAAVVRGREKASGAYRDPPDPWMDELYRDCYDPYRLSLAAGEAQGSGKTDLAIQRLERALRFAPENVSLHFQLGGTHLAANNYTLAREHFRRCTEVDPRFPDGWAQLSQLLEKVGDRTGADRVLAEGLRHCPTSPGLHLLQARRLNDAGRTEEAVGSYRESIRLRPNEADAYIELAMIYFDRDDIDEGVAELEWALQAEPGHPVVLSTLALNAIIRGDEAEARKWMRRAGDQPRVDPDRMDSLKAAFRDKFGRDWNR